MTTTAGESYNPYRNIRATRYKGKRYRSAFEASVARDLDERKVPFQYEAETFLYEMPTTYVADFSLPLGVIIECKGYMDARTRKHLLYVKKKYPNTDIRLLFQRASTKLARGPQSMTYGQWATKHGFVWAEKTVPESWVLARK